MNTGRVFYLIVCGRYLVTTTSICPSTCLPCLAGHIATQNKRLYLPVILGAGFIHMPKFLGEGNSKPFHYSCLENPMNSLKRQKDRTLKDELPRSIDVHYATGDQWRNNSRKNEEIESRQKQHPVVDVTGDGSKLQCCKGQYCIGTWNVRCMNRGKLEVVK